MDQFLERLQKCKGLTDTIIFFYCANFVYEEINMLESS